MNILKSSLKLFFLFIAFLFLINLASAQLQVQLDVKSNFNYGEEVYFNYSIISQEGIEGLIYYTPYIYCESSPQPLLSKEEANLKIGEILTKKYIYGIIDDNYNSGECTASVSIEQPYPQYLEKKFIITSRKEMNFQLRTCADYACEIPKKVFEKGEIIYFVYESAYSSSNTKTRGSGLNIQAELSVPKTRGSSEIELIKKGEKATRGSSISANNIGTYEINIDASADGYKEVKLKYPFAVIEKGVLKTTSATGRVSDEFSDEKEPGLFYKISMFFRKIFSKFNPSLSPPPLEEPSE